MSTSIYTGFKAPKTCWGMYPSKHILALGDTDLRVNRAHEHIDLHVNKRSRTCRDGGDTDLRVNRAHGHLDLHVNKGS